MAEIARLEAVVHGYVQGVSFRYYTCRQADKLGLAGWVANRRDGTVKVVAEGPREALSHLAAWLRRGAPSARVDQVDLNWAEASGQFDRFDIRYRY